MSKKFEIKFFLIPEKGDLLLEYPDCHELLKKETVNSWGYIKFKVGVEHTKKLIGSYATVREDGFIGEYLGYFFLNLDKIIKKLLNNKKCEILFFDSGQSLKFKPNYETVEITFDYNLDVKKSNIENIPIPKKEVIKELINSLEMFIKKIQTINPKIKETQYFKRIENEKNESIKLYEEYYLRKK